MRPITKLTRAMECDASSWEFEVTTRENLSYHPETGVQYSSIDIPDYHDHNNPLHPLGDRNVVRQQDGKRETRVIRSIEGEGIVRNMSTTTCE